MTVAITGHRPSKLDNDYTYTSALWRKLRERYAALYTEFKVQHVLTGCALGVDTVAAETAAANGIPYTAYVPFIGQPDRWLAASQQRYQDLLAGADDIIVVSPGGYAAWKLHRRNEAMIDAAEWVLATWTGDAGGTKSAVEYALRTSKEVMQLNPTTMLDDWYDG